MNRSYKILTAVVLASALIVGGGLVSSTKASSQEEKLARKVVTDYVDGFKQGDIQKMIDNVKDTRVQNEAELKSDYEYYVSRKKESNMHMKFVDLEKVDDKTFKATFEISSNEFKASTYELPVVNENGTWKIFVDGSVVVETNK